MTTKECIEQVKTLIDSKTGIRGLLDWDNEALQTLISLAEQVEGVRGTPKEGSCPDLNCTCQEVAVLKAQVKDAYLSGYERGHDDTVESCYGRQEDKADEYVKLNNL